MINIDFNKIVEQLPDLERRTQKRLDWMKIYALYLTSVYQRLLADYNNAKFIVSHTTQVLSIQDALNKSIALNVPIVLEDGLHFLNYYMNLLSETYSEDIYMYADSETEPDESFMFTDLQEEYNDYFDIFVYVNNTDVNKMAEIIKIIDTYIAMGITYKIIII